ncbi:MAG: tetratricopeptide repeat protein [Planctomyces sp.]
MLGSRTEAVGDPRIQSRSRPKSVHGIAGSVFRLCLLGSVFCSTGCSMWSGEDDSTLMERMLDTSRIRGPMERRLGWEDDSPLALGEKFSPEARKKVDEAIALADRGEHDDAAKAFKKLAKEYKDSSIGEEAQYRLAESYYAMEKYAKAQDAYDQLFEDYPSTRYVEPVTRRLFTIAQQWLEISDPVSRNAIRQVSSTNDSDAEDAEDDKTPPKPPRDPTLRYRIIPNFHDRSRPIFDTQGRALQALKSIWLNDPIGPRAADALMMTATYYQRRSNYVEADRYYKILREEYPNSRHFEDAFVLGSHAKLMSYQGAYYEGSDLEAAGKLKEQSLHLFPASESRQQIREDLKRVYLMEAERAWARVQYYQQKGRPRAIAIACVNLVTDFPDTGFATECRKILRGLDRNQLKDLPEIVELIESLPQDSGPAGTEPATEKPRVKSVSRKRDITDEADDEEPQRPPRAKDE